MAQTYIDAFNEKRKGSIKLTFEINKKSVDFLDITIFKGTRFSYMNILDFKTFQKPINTYLYLPPFSFHNSKIFKGYISSELKRYRISCNNYIDYNEVKQNFYVRLLKRGYKKIFLSDIFDKDLDRNELLQKQSITLLSKTNTKKKLNTSTPLIFKTIYTPRQQQMKLRDCLKFDDRLNSDFLSSQIFKLNKKGTGAPIICYRRTKNLGEFITSSKLKRKIKFHLIDKAIAIQRDNDDTFAFIMDL
jgi:hypothetical protein